MFKDYLLQNWPLILILLAFVISLATTVFLQKRTVIRWFILIGLIFALSIIVFIEFYLADKGQYRMVRTVLMAIRYSATPVLLALISLTLIKRMHWAIIIPSLVVVLLNFISIFTGIIFKINTDNSLIRGPIWLIPYIAVGLYGILLVYLLIRRSNKRVMEIIPIIFLAFSLGSGLVLPFIFREAYASIFCVTIAIALFSYYEFTVIQLTKKDSLTGLLNRHAYFADISNDPSSITALISVDMNGLKYLNDNIGHTAGDEALISISLCLARPLSNKQSAYRVGGDEFIIVCRKTSEEAVEKIIEKIKKYVKDTGYSCAIGYSFNLEGNKPISDLLKESDKMMYEEKEKHYLATGEERRRA